MTEQQVNTVKPLKAKKPFYKKWWVWLIAIVFVIAIAGGEEEVTPNVATEPVKVEANEPVTAEPETTEEVVEEEEVTEPVVEEPKEPEMTVAQKNAVRKAEDYISLTGFSKSGLIEQLSFEGFSNEDATFAVNNIKVDWKEQAGIKAKEYMDLTGFSRSGLIEQLEFEGFTTEEATYGADKVGI